MAVIGKTAVILVEHMFNDLEFWYPYYRLKEAGVKVMKAGSGSAWDYVGQYGTSVCVEFSAEQISPADVDALIIPGGYAPDHMRRHPSMVKLVRKVFQGGKVVAAICHAGWLLASADILKGRTATSFFSIKDDMVHAGAKWVDQEVSVDGNLITSRRPDDLPAFMKAVLSALE
jgi:protease I